MNDTYEAYWQRRTLVSKWDDDLLAAELKGLEHGQVREPTAGIAMSEKWIEVIRDEIAHRANPEDAEE